MAFTVFKGFQDIDFPRCAIIIQDFKDSKKWFPKMYHNYSTSQRFQKMVFGDVLIFRDVPQLFKISKIPRYWCSKMYWDLLRFQDVYPFSKSLKPIFLTPAIFQQNHFHSVWPPPFPKSSTLAVRIFGHPPFPTFSNNEFHHLDIYKKWKWFGSSLVFISNLVYSNPQIRVPRGLKNTEIMTIEVFGLSHKQIEKL